MSTPVLAQIRTLAAMPLLLLAACRGDAATEPRGPHGRAPLSDDAVGNSAPNVVDLRSDPGGEPFVVSTKSCGGRYTVCLRFRVADADGESDGPFAVTVDWGDGTPWTPNRVPLDTPLLAPHDYAAPGAYRVHVTATDASGTENGDALTLVVTAEPPDTSLPECRGPVSVSVSGGTEPTITWTPACRVAGLLVESEGDDVWFVTSGRANGIAPGITYGAVPATAAADPDTPLVPLAVGQTYLAAVARYAGPGEEFVLAGTASFAP